MLEGQTNQPAGSFSYGLGNRCCELSELLKPVLMLPSRRKGQERVKSQNPRWLGVKEWDIGRTEQYAKRRHYGEVQRWGRPSKLTWRTFSSWHKPSSKETPFHLVFSATSWLTQHPFLRPKCQKLYFSDSPASKQRGLGLQDIFWGRGQGDTIQPQQSSSSFGKEDWHSLHILAVVMAV